MTKRTNPLSSGSQRSLIRWSTPEDLTAIRDWLVEEKERGVHENFLCNWSVIESSHQHKQLLVYIDGASAKPVGFQLGQLVQPGILQVHSAHRGKGIGKKLVQKCFSIAKRKNTCLLHIECTPATSIPFWKRMGFTIVEDRDGKHYGYQILEKNLKVPEQGFPVRVEVQFFPERRKWEPETAPYSIHSPSAALTPDGIVHLAKRLSFHRGLHPDAQDVVFQIAVNGDCLYRDKAKYDRASEIGVKRCPHGFYLDSINTSSAALSAGNSSP